MRVFNENYSFESYTTRISSHTHSFFNHQTFTARCSEWKRKQARRYFRVHNLNTMTRMTRCFKVSSSQTLNSALSQRLQRATYVFWTNETTRQRLHVYLRAAAVRNVQVIVTCLSSSGSTVAKSGVSLKLHCTRNTHTRANTTHSSSSLNKRDTYDASLISRRFTRIVVATRISSSLINSFSSHAVFLISRHFQFIFPDMHVTHDTLVWMRKEINVTIFSCT